MIATHSPATARLDGANIMTIAPSGAARTNNVNQRVRLNLGGVACTLLE